jgi:hypothetical protein
MTTATAITQQNCCELQARAIGRTPTGCPYMPEKVAECCKNGRRSPEEFNGIGSAAWNDSAANADTTGQSFGFTAANN